MQFWRFSRLNSPYNTYKSYIVLPYITYKYAGILPFIAYKYGLKLNRRRGARRDFKDRSEIHGLGMDRGKRHQSPLLTSMVRFTEPPAKGRGSRWSVIRACRSDGTHQRRDFGNAA